MPVKIGNHCWNTLKTNVGVPQVDSLSPIFFVHLFKALETVRKELTFNNIYGITYADNRNFHFGDDGLINDSQMKQKIRNAKFRLRVNKAETQRFYMTNSANLRIKRTKVNTTTQIEYKK